MSGLNFHTHAPINMSKCLQIYKILVRAGFAQRDSLKRCILVKCIVLIETDVQSGARSHDSTTYNRGTELKTTAKLWWWERCYVIGGMPDKMESLCLE